MRSPVSAERALRRLQIAEDLSFQRRTWRFERIGWTAFCGVILAGAAGLFGGGPLGDVEARSADGQLSVTHPRFARRQSSLELVVRASPAAPAQGELRIWFTEQYLAELDIERVTPPPERVELGAARIEYVFPWRGPRGTASITFFLQVQQPGFVRGEVGSGEGPGVPVRHFVYP